MGNVALQNFACSFIAYSQSRTAQYLSKHQSVLFAFPSVAGFFDICQRSPPALVVSSHLSSQFVWWWTPAESTFLSPCESLSIHTRRHSLNTRPRGNILFLIDSQRRTEHHLLSTLYSSFHDELGVFRSCNNMDSLRRLLSLERIARVLSVI